MIRSSETFDPVNKVPNLSIVDKQANRVRISKPVLLVPIIRTGPFRRTVLITGGSHCSFSLLHYPFYYVYILLYKKVYTYCIFYL